jgi:hypothetical protein
MQAASLEDRQNTVIEKVRELSARVTEAKSQTILQQTALAQVELLGTNTEALLLLPACGEQSDAFWKSGPISPAKNLKPPSSGSVTNRSIRR